MSAFVLTRLDYCNVVFANLPAATVAPLQRAQNAAARLVKGLGPRDHVSSDLTDETSFKRRLKTFLFQQAYTVQ